MTPGAGTCRFASYDAAKLRGPMKIRHDECRRSPSFGAPWLALRTARPEWTSFRKGSELPRGVVEGRRHGHIDACRQRKAVVTRELTSPVLPLAENDREFIERLNDRGEIVPDLLMNVGELQARLATHPGLRWKAQNVREHAGKRPDA